MDDASRTKRGVFIALGLLAAVAATAVAYRYIGERPVNSVSRASATIKIGSQNFVRWETPRVVPSIAFTDANGGSVSLEQFRGRVVLLNVWATWCVPCRKEMPLLDALQAKLGGPDFEVVAVNTDTRDPDRPKAWLKEVGVSRLAYYADPSGKLFQDLKVAGKALGLPTTLLIDRAGCELGTIAGPADWASEDAIKLDLQGTTKDEILKELIGLLKLDEKSEGMLFKMLKRRENLGSTGIGRGIAIPHCRSLVVNRLRVAFGRKASGVDFKAIDEKSVNFFFLIVAPPLEVSNQYLPVLGKIAQFSKETDVPQRLLTLKEPKEFLALLEEKGV